MKNSIPTLNEVILDIAKQSRLFNEPEPPKATNESLAAELDAVIVELHETALNMRRLEHRLVLIKAKVEGLETIQKP